MYHLKSSVEIHIEGEDNDAFQISPYPLPNLLSKGCCLVYLRKKKKGNKNEFKDKNFLITANKNNDTVDINAEENIEAKKIEEDKYGCSNGRNIGKSILPLFAFQQLQKYEKKDDISEDEKKNAIGLSISSGVLCKYTGYVGISKEPLTQNDYDEVEDDSDSSSEDRSDSDSDSDKLLKMMAKKAMKSCKPEKDCKLEEDCKLDEDKLKMMIEEEKKFYKSRQCKKEDSSDNESDSNFYKAKKCSESPSPVKNHYDLMNILHSQNFNGYWENLDEINEMLGLNVSKNNGVDVTDKKIANKCIATILALAALHVKSMNQKNIWIMIEIKAIDWLKINLPNADINQLIKDTES